MPDQNLAYRSATDLLNLIKSKQVSPVEVTELFLQRIEDIDHQLNSFLLVTHDIAIEQAKAAENAIMRGDDLGPLHGLPIPIKDNQMTGGIRTTSGSIIFKDHVPQNHAAFLERILRDWRHHTRQNKLLRTRLRRNVRKLPRHHRQKPLGHRPNTRWI